MAGAVAKSIVGVKSEAKIQPVLLPDAPRLLTVGKVNALGLAVAHHPHMRLGSRGEVVLHAQYAALAHIVDAYVREILRVRGFEAHRARSVRVPQLRIDRLPGV